MKLHRFGRLSAVAALGVLALAACGTDNNTTATGSTGSAGATSAAAASTDCKGGTLNGAGSTFQQPMQQQWASQFPSVCNGAQVNYQGVGSGTGIEQFGSGTIDFAGSDVTMKPEQQAAADKRCGDKAITLPVSAGGVAITYNLPGGPAINLDGETIAKIFTGKITKWNDPALKADNAGVNLPDLPITVYYRSDGSGTTGAFTQYMTDVAGDVWTAGSGTTVEWKVGQGAKGSSGVTAGVKQTQGGITYTEQSYALQNKLPTAKVKNPAGSYIEVTSDAVSKALKDTKITGTGNDLSAKIDYKPTDPAAYPISTLTYAIVCQSYSDAAKASLLKSYLTYAVTDGQQFAQQLGYAPLDSSLADKVKASVASIKG